jgi:hypothetical protein
VATVTRAAAKGAAAELACTTARVPALAAAGVVDAGGQGLVLMLDVLADVTDAVTAAITDTGPPVWAAATTAAHDPSAPLAFAYEVQYTLEAPAAVVPALRARLDKLGDSVAVSTGADRHNVHVHVNDVGAAIEAALDLGRPSRIRVTRFSDRISGGDV